MKKIALFILLAFSCTMTSMAQLNGSGYYRLRNVAYPTHYTSLHNHIFNYTTIISTAGGGLRQFLLDGTNAKNRAFNCASLYLQTDIHLIEDADCIIPSTIIYFYSRSSSNYDLQAQGTSLIAITTGNYPGSQVLNFENLNITIKSSSGSGANTRYYASIPIKASNYSLANLGTRYFVDNNGTFAIAENYSSDNAKWYIEPVNHFNVNAQIAYGQKYYATMYTAFPYQLSGTVEKAYVVSEIDLTNHKVRLTQIAETGGTVPAGTPVILECGSGESSDNQLIPTGTPLVCSYSTDNTTAPAPSTVTNYEGENYLSGTYFCNTDGKLTFQTKSGTSSFNANDYTSNNQNTMRVLGVNSEGKLGFFKLASSVKYMAANKAWLDLSALPASANNISLSKFNIVFNGIEENDDNEEPMVSEDGGFPDNIAAVQNDESHTVVYDLQGRRVSSENLAKGIYIVNGKKVFIQ